MAKDENATTETVANIAVENGITGVFMIAKDSRNSWHVVYVNGICYGFFSHETDATEKFERLTS